MTPSIKTTVVALVMSGCCAAARADTPPLTVDPAGGTLVLVIHQTGTQAACLEGDGPGAGVTGDVIAGSWYATDAALADATPDLPIGGPYSGAYYENDTAGGVTPGGADDEKIVGLLHEFYWTGTAAIDPLSLVKAKTDNLPTDPADDSDLDAAIAAINTLATAVKAKTDNLPSDPADDSDLDAAIAAAKAVVDAIKAKTDNLPTDPADDSDLDAAIAAINTLAEAVFERLPDDDQRIAGADDLEHVGGLIFTPVAPTTVHKSRTWFPGEEGWESGNIVYVKAGFTGTLAAEVPLNPGFDVETFDEVEIADPNEDEVVAEDLAIRGDGKAVHFDVPELTVVGDYTVVVYYSTKDGQEPPFACKLVVR